MRYRLFRPEDFAQIYAIEEACFQPPVRFPRAYMRQLVRSDDTATWVAEDDSGVAGFAIVEWASIANEVVAYIQTIEVAPEQRRKGVGMELLRRMEESARAAEATQIWLHVDVANDAAIRLYRAQGYEKRGTEEHYYARNRAAEIYSKELEPAKAK